MSSPRCPPGSQGPVVRSGRGRERARFLQRDPTKSPPAAWKQSPVSGLPGAHPQRGRAGDSVQVPEVGAHSTDGESEK